MSEEVTIKKSISLREDVYQYALEQAEKYYGGNFSAYLTYLISCQKNNTDYITYKNGKEVTILTKDKIDRLLINDRWLKDIFELFDEGLIIVDKTHISIDGKILRILLNKHLIVKSMGLDKKYDISITI